MQKINIESKNSLARLMATENLVVQHKKVSTASFDVKNRVLSLPIWKDMDHTMYEGLIGHEVGHALYTPFEAWKEFITENPGLKDYANVLEDARIEKKMKTKFPGMRKVFFGMYDQLNVKDFFGIAGKDVSSYGLLDRINLHFKLGSRTDIIFNDEETLFVGRVAKAETFQEILELTLELAEYAKNEELNTDFDDMEFGDTDDEDNDDGDEIKSGNSQDKLSDEFGDSDDAGDEVEDDNSKDGDDQGQDEDNDDGAGSGGKKSDDPPQSKTQKNFDDSMSDLNDAEAYTPIYVDLPNVNVKDITVSYKKNVKILSEFYSDPTSYGYWDEDGNAYKKKIDDEIRNWKKDVNPVVNYMVKEFEMKQAASAHRRTSVGKTGVLDTNKMHAYRYEEDIFKRVATIKDGRNHGLVMYVDWSGSMQDKILDTVKQTITLVMFARKVGIPFRVYGFSNAIQSQALVDNANFYEVEDNKNFGFDHIKLNRLTLLEFFNEKMSASEFSNMINNFYKVGKSNDWNTRSSVRNPNGYSLASTPLNECIIASYEQVANFKRETGKEKVNVIFLTDGHSDGNDTYYDTSNTGFRTGYISWGPDKSYLAIRDPKTRKVITTTNEFRKVTGDLLKGLGQRCDVNVIGFFLTDSRKINYSIDCEMSWTKADDMKKQARKNGYVALSSFGYDKYFMVNNTAMSKEVKFDDVGKKDDGSVNKAKLRTAFQNFSKGRKVNKMLLNEFVGMVA